MARITATLLLLFAYGSCMEMRETVERMVMVRTTGSDLQPAATGYIYKKESDGPASVVKMGESEVFEHFSKMYSKPEAYKAPLPAAAGPFYVKGEDEDKAVSHATEERIKPVVENADEHQDHDDRIDGIASEDYDKMFEEYAKQYGSGYKKDFTDYLHGLGHYDHGIYHEHGGGKDYALKGYHGHGDKGHKGHDTKHHYEKGGSGDYNSEKYEGYSASKEGGHKRGYNEGDVSGKHYADGHEYKGDEHGHKADHDKGEAVDGFQKVYDKNEFKKDHDLYDGEGLKGGRHKYADRHENHGSETGGYEKGASHDLRHHQDGFRKGEYVDKESGDEHDAAHSSGESGESNHHHDGKFGVKDGNYAGKSYGYEVKH